MWNFSLATMCLVRATTTFMFLRFCVFPPMRGILAFTYITSTSSSSSFENIDFLPGESEGKHQDDDDEDGDDDQSRYDDSSLGVRRLRCTYIQAFVHRLNYCCGSKRRLENYTHVEQEKKCEPEDEWVKVQTYIDELLPLRAAAAAAPNVTPNTNTNARDCGLPPDFVAACVSEFNILTQDQIEMLFHLGQPLDSFAWTLLPTQGSSDISSDWIGRGGVLLYTQQQLDLTNLSEHWFLPLKSLFPGCVFILSLWEACVCAQREVDSFAMSDPHHPSLRSATFFLQQIRLLWSHQATWTPRVEEALGHLIINPQLYKMWVRAEIVGCRQLPAIRTDDDEAQKLDLLLFYNRWKVHPPSRACLVDFRQLVLDLNSYKKQCSFNIQKSIDIKQSGGRVRSISRFDQKSQVSSNINPIRNCDLLGSQQFGALALLNLEALLNLTIRLVGEVENQLVLWSMPFAKRQKYSPFSLWLHLLVQTKTRLVERGEWALLDAVVILLAVIGTCKISEFHHLGDMQHQLGWFEFVVANTCTLRGVDALWSAILATKPFLLLRHSEKILKEPKEPKLPKELKSFQAWQTGHSLFQKILNDELPIIAHTHSFFDTQRCEEEIILQLEPTQDTGFNQHKTLEHAELFCLYMQDWERALFFGGVPPPYPPTHAM